MRTLFRCIFSGGGLVAAWTRGLDVAAAELFLAASASNVRATRGHARIFANPRIHS